MTPEQRAAEAYLNFWTDQVLALSPYYHQSNLGFFEAAIERFLCAQQ